MHLTERSARGMTNKCSVERNSIPVHVVNLFSYALNRRKIDKLFN